MVYQYCCRSDLISSKQGCDTTHQNQSYQYLFFAYAQKPNRTALMYLPVSFFLQNTTSSLPSSQSSSAINILPFSYGSMFQGELTNRLNFQQLQYLIIFVCNLSRMQMKHQCRYSDITFNFDTIEVKQCFKCLVFHIVDREVKVL
ncbi:hypothetical protein EhV164_00427 [Emiliania huxleyi virus 164]|nr:hypothetical protein EhV164_00427 [Emiliania huxleyi virus 164]